MTTAARTKTPRRGKRSASQYFIAAIVALGVAASIVSLFFDSPRLLRLGVVLAVWAALLGAIAMTKFRRESAIDQAKVRDLQTVYELQLEREISARREFELGVESRVRDELRPDAQEIAALRAELASLRNSLEMLYDGRMPVDRVALRADSTRMQELASGPYSSYQPAPSGLFVPDAGVQRFSTPYDAPVTAETSVVPEEGEVPAAAEPEPVVEEPVVAEAVAEEPEPEAGGSRRRRRAEPVEETDDSPSGSHSSGRSVAEILAGLQSESAGQAASGGRRRAAD